MTKKKENPQTAGRHDKYTPAQIQDFITKFKTYIEITEIPTVNEFERNSNLRRNYIYGRKEFVELINILRQKSRTPSNKKKYDYELSWKQRTKEKYHLDIQYKIRINFAANLNYLLNNKANKSKFKDIIKDLVGYDIETLRRHLESKFNEKMNWNNHGSYWQIDHILPDDYFSYKSYEDPDFRKCWSLDNLQPLEKTKNILKANRIINHDIQN